MTLRLTISARGRRKAHVSVTSAHAAQAFLRTFVEEAGIGARDFDSANLYEGARKIAVLSYSGTVTPLKPERGK